LTIRSKHKRNFPKPL